MQGFRRLTSHFFRPCSPVFNAMAVKLAVKAVGHDRAGGGSTRRHRGNERERSRTTRPLGSVIAIQSPNRPGGCLTRHAFSPPRVLSYPVVKPRPHPATRVRNPPCWHGNGLPGRRERAGRAWGGKERGDPTSLRCAFLQEGEEPTAVRRKRRGVRMVPHSPSATGISIFLLDYQFDKMREKP
jgi:hypothetical protein